MELMILPSNATWFLASVVGIAVGIASVNEAREDIEALRKTRLNGTKRFLAKFTIVQEALRLMIQGLICLMAVISFFGPRPVPEHEFLGGIFAFASVLLTAKSAIGLYAKRKLLQMVTSKRSKKLVGKKKR